MKALIVVVFRKNKKLNRSFQLQKSLQREKLKKRNFGLLWLTSRVLFFAPRTVLSAKSENLFLL